MTATELTEIIKKEYNVVPDYPWLGDTACVFRHTVSRKWFALLMLIPEKYIGLQGDKVIPVLNLKAENIRDLIRESGIYLAYHMNKQHWISVDLREMNAKKIKILLDMSFNLTMQRKDKVRLNSH